MKYIIMCGGTYDNWSIPRQLSKINGEVIVARTIRLLKENGISDIAISSNDEVFEQFGVPVLKHRNNFYVETTVKEGYWVNAFYPIDGPVCYLFGDVYFSDEAIKTIINTQTDDIEFFASCPPYSIYCAKQGGEPFALKVVNQDHLRTAIDRVIELDKLGKWNRHPIVWELWQVIKGTPINHIDWNNFTPINDYTCDVDNPWDIPKIEDGVRRWNCQ